MKRMEMDLEHNQEKGVYIVKLKGKLDVFSFGELKGFFDDLYDKSSAAKVVCDITDVSYVASSGWSVLLARRKVARRDGGDLCLVGMSADIRRVYDSMKIAKLLPTVASVDEGAALMKEGE